MSEPKRISPFSWIEPLAVALSLGLFFSCLDVFLAAAQRDWLGGPWSAWRAWFVGLAILAAPIAVAAVIPWALLKKTRLRHVAAPFGGLIAALIWWQALTGTGDGVPGGMALTVYGVLAAWTVLHAAANVVRPAQSVTYDIVTVVALGAGVVLLRDFAQLFFLDPDRAVSWRAWSVIWTAFSFLLCLGLGWLAWPRDSRCTGPVGIAIAVCFSLPVAMAFAPRLLSVGLEKRGPSILLITADALRADYCSTYGGHVPTPAMDAMAARGTRLNRFRTLAPWTLPSLNGAFASKYPPGLTPHASYDTRFKEIFSYAQLRDYWCDPGSRTFVRELRREKYVTCILLGNPLMADEEWLMEGFQHRLVADPLTNRVQPLGQNPLLQALMRDATPQWFFERPTDSTWVLTKCARLFLERYGRGDFFLWLHYMDPHDPYDPPERYRIRQSRWPFFPPDDVPSRTFWAISDHLKFDADDKASIQSLYEGEIRYVDEALGSVLEVYDQVGLADSTHVIFSSDHGEEFWDHGRWGHGQSMYDELLHVPFIVIGPGIPVGTVEKPVSAIDLIPTIADLMGIDMSPQQQQWQGTSFTSLLRRPGEVEPGPPIFAVASGLYADQEPLEAVITPSHKFIRGIESGSLELYLLNEDPEERVNCVDAYPDLAQRLTVTLDALDSMYPSTFEAALAQTGYTELEAPLREAVDLFRDIGYLDADADE